VRFLAVDPALRSAVPPFPSVFVVTLAMAILSDMSPGSTVLPVQSSVRGLHLCLGEPVGSGRFTWVIGIAAREGGGAHEPVAEAVVSRERPRR
jgi:hypothetical protein